MDTLVAQPITTTPRSWSALTKLPVAALIGLAGSLVYVQAMIIGELVPDLTLFLAIMLLAASIIAGVPVGGWRWTPLLGTFLSVLVIAGNWGAIVYDITHPEAFHLFAFMVVAVALALLGTVVGIAATVQNYRRAASDRHTPRSLPVALAALVALCTGALLVAAIPRQASMGISPELLAQLPAITTPGLHFDQTEITAKVGETVALRIDNPDQGLHSFDIDELNVHVPVAPGESGLVLFEPTEPGTYTFYCSAPGHREAGMEGTLIVEP